MQNRNSLLIIAAIILAAGLTAAGISIGSGLYRARAADRFVTVKGLAETEVDADLAIWPVTFRVSDNRLDELQQKINSDRTAVRDYLLEAGFSREEISYSAPRISDLRTDERYRTEKEPEERYVANIVVTVKSGDVPLVKKTMEASAELVGMGVAVSAENWQNPTEFLYTRLNDIKPAMIEEATRNAREAAEKFAQDSGSKVGKIRRANQGYFSISDRDRNSPDKKTVRVVTTVEYFLVD